MKFHWWWLAAAAIVFLFLWGWRELGLRLALERTATRDAEARLEHQSGELLADQLNKIGSELSTVSTVIPVSGLTKGSARVFVDDKGRGVLAISGVSKGTYDLQADGQKVTSVDVPRSGQRTVTLDHLPAGAKSFGLTAR